MFNPSQKKIIPAIIPTSLEHLKESLELVRPFTREVQIDIVDGIFVPFKSWPFVGGSSPYDLKDALDGFEVELDMMIVHPHETLESYLVAGVKRVVIHVESHPKLEKIALLKSDFDFKLGFSILNDSDLTLITDHVTIADYIQLMGIAKIGSQGQPFDERVLTRIQSIKTFYPTLEVSIDGSVNKETLPRLIEAGADRFAVGSAIMSASSPEDAYNELLDKAN